MPLVPRRHSRSAALPALALIALTILVPACAERPPEPQAAATHVLFVVLDTLRTDHLSCYGYEWPTSPSIDALAARGVRFETCWSGASWTMPSMISLMTSRRLLTTLYRIPGPHPVLAEQLAQAGYRTGAVVANSLLSAEAGFDRGVEHFAARQRGDGRWRAATVNERALQFIDADDGRPFFLWLHYLDTHTPYEPEALPLQRDAEQVFSTFERAAIEQVLDEQPADERRRLAFQRDVLAREVDRYDAELIGLDQRLGELFAALEDRGLAEDTLVVLVADHGETLFRRREHPIRQASMVAWRAEQGQAVRLEDHLKKEHDGWVSEELVRTPWILAGPGLPAGRVDSALVSNLDVVPTLLGLLGLATDDVDGRDLSAALRAGEPVPDADWVTSASSFQLAARAPGGLKVVLPNAAQQKRFGHEPQAYDLGADPFELTPRPPTAQAQALLRRLQEAADADVHRDWDGSAPDAATLETLKELGYVR